MPAVYFIFHEFFLKSAVGESAWKSSVLDEENEDEENTNISTRPLASIQVEAFTMLLLKNNYFAWLLTAKTEMKDSLVTDYDDLRSRVDLVSFVEIILKKMEINLIDFPQGETFVASPENVKDLVMNDQQPRFNALRRHTREQIEKIQKDVETSAMFQKITAQISHSNVYEDPVPEIMEADSNEVNATTSKPAKKNDRKSLKQFRVYTNPMENEKRFKGWSQRAKADQSDMMLKLEQDPEKCKQFRAAYRILYKIKNESTAKKRKSVEEAPEFDYQANIWRRAARQRVEI